MIQKLGERQKDLVILSFISLPHAYSIQTNTNIKQYTLFETVCYANIEEDAVLILFAHDFICHRHVFTLKFSVHFEFHVKFTHPILYIVTHYNTIYILLQCCLVFVILMLMCFSMLLWFYCYILYSSILLSHTLNFIF